MSVSLSACAVKLHHRMLKADIQIKWVLHPMQTSVQYFYISTPIISKKLNLEQSPSYIVYRSIGFDSLKEIFAPFFFCQCCMIVFVIFASRSRSLPNSRT